MKKVLIVVSLLTAIATPAFAQSFDPEFGTANVLPFSYATTAHTAARTDRANAENAFAMAPRAAVNQDIYSPANVGGGSEGYNWDLAHNY